MVSWVVGSTYIAGSSSWTSNYSIRIVSGRTPTGTWTNVPRSVGTTRTTNKHAIFDLAATANPMIPYTPAIHIPDLHHICLERQTPSPTISITNSQEVTEEIYVISIPPLHHSKCLECKTICQQQIRQGLRALMPTGTSITEYGTFSTWGRISLQAQERGWTHLPYRVQSPITQATGRIPNEVWDTLDRDSALCTIHKIQYFRQFWTSLWYKQPPSSSIWKTHRSPYTGHREHQLTHAADSIHWTHLMARRTTKTE